MTHCTYCQETADTVRADYGTFEDYAEKRWQMSRSRAYRMIEAASVVDSVSPIGDIAPSNEGQARELSRVPESERTAVWTETVERTDGACPRCVPVLTAAGVFGHEGLERALKLRGVWHARHDLGRQAAAEAAGAVCTMVHTALPRPHPEAAGRPVRLRPRR